MQKLKRHLWLIGFSGSGKSTVGPRLAKLMRFKFEDTDLLIERGTGLSISRLFQSYGERRFRQLESLSIANLAASEKPLVIALGGGAFQSPRNRQLIRQSGHSIFLQAGATQLLRRLSSANDRPLLQITPKHGELPRTARLRKITSLLKRRESNYRKADLTIRVGNLTPLQIARLIKQRVSRLHA